MEKLTGKTAVITGGNSGIGFATAELFIKHGAKVILTGRNKNTTDDAVSLLGNNASGVIAEAADMQQIKSLGEQVRGVTEKIDIIFINAGVGKFNTVEHMTEEMFDEIMDVNFKGAYFALQQLLPLLNDGGSIILNTSINAHIGMEGATVYAASKSALLSLVKNLSVELIPRKIRVNAISPGPVGTPLHSAEKLGISEEQLTAMGEGILKQIPLGRFGQVEEIANIALFLASNDSSFILGTEIIADGGMSSF